MACRDSTPDVAVLIKSADRAARRLCRKLMLPAADLDDLRQDLLVDLICRLPSYDPCRGSLEAFASVVLRNRCSRIAVQQYHRLRAQGGPIMSLDAPAAGEEEPLGSLLAESDGLTAWHGQDGSETEKTDCRLDLERALSELSEQAQDVCIALSTSTIAELVGRKQFSRSALYRWVSLLRLDLAMRGIGARWDGFQSA